MKASHLLLPQFHHEHSWLFVVEREGADAAYQHWSKGQKTYSSKKLVQCNPHDLLAIEYSNYNNGYIIFYEWVKCLEQSLIEFTALKQKSIEADLYVGL